MHKNTITHGATEAQKDAKTSQGNASASVAIAKAKTPNNTGTATSPRQSRWFGALITITAAVTLVLAGCGDDATSGDNATSAADTAAPAVTNLRVTALAAISEGVSVTVEWQNPTNATNYRALLDASHSRCR